MRKALTIAALAAVASAPVYVCAQPGPQGTGQGPQQQGPGVGPGPQRGMTQGQPQRGMTREMIYGSQMMTLEERQAHQQKMWSAKTAAERQGIRDANRKAMTERAKTQGVRIDEKQSDTFWMEE